MSPFAPRPGRRLLSAAGTVLLLAGLLPASAAPVLADSSVQSLPFSQDWTNTGLITTNDDWTGVPGIVGYRGQDITNATGVDPQTLLADVLVANDLDVIANHDPSTFTNGGVAEFDGDRRSDVALQGSGHGRRAASRHHRRARPASSNVTVAYNLRDIDASTDNAVQPVALQYRVGSSGDYTNVPAGFVADATTGPSLATLVTPVSAHTAGRGGQPAARAGPDHDHERRRQRRDGSASTTSRSRRPSGDAAPSVQSTTPGERRDRRRGRRERLESRSASR